MKNLTIKLKHRYLRKNRIRSSVHGSITRPRLTVYVSIRHITAQLIDDDASKTLIYVSTVGRKKLANNLTQKAEYVGTEIAKKALQAGYNKVVFDRNGKIYHGRIKVLAIAARAAGLEF